MCVVVVRGLPSCGGYNVLTVLCNAGLHRAMTGGGRWRDWHRPCFLDITVITAIISLLSQPRTTGAQRQQIGLLVPSSHVLVHFLSILDRVGQGGLIGVLNKQPSVIMFTFSLKLGPHAHTACVKLGPHAHTTGVKPPPPC